MAYYVTYWPADWVKTILKNGDTGPLAVIYGGEHRSQPPLGKVTVGDVVFPVTLNEGQLFVLGRLTISEIRKADEYAENILKIDPNALMWDDYTRIHKDSVTHCIPRTCADDAATGTDGSVIALRPVSADRIAQIRLGPKDGGELPLKMRGNSISINNFSGYFRRLSTESAEIFDHIIQLG